MRNFSACCRFAYSALPAREKEEYKEYTEEVESWLCREEASTPEEAKALCVKPEINQYPFNDALKILKEEHPFLKDCCHSQALLQKVTDLY